MCRTVRYSMALIRAMKILLLTACLAAATDFNPNGSSQCQSVLSKVTSVDLDGCPDGVVPCRLSYGGNATVTINFTYQAVFEIDDVRAYARLHYSELDYDAVKNIDHFPCKNGVLDCPLKPKQSYTYKGTIEFEDYYPQPHYTLEVQLNDGYHYPTVCVQIKIRLYG